MSRYRIKTLLNVVWTVLDAELGSTEPDTLSLERKAKEIQFRHLIVETLEPRIEGEAAGQRTGSPRPRTHPNETPTRIR